jgi:hypothetical protein
VLHGIAGSSHFLGVIPALALPTRGAAMMYIAGFGAGTVVAMTLFAAAIGILAGRTRHPQRMHGALLATAAVLAIVVGGIWLVPSHP